MYGVIAVVSCRRCHVQIRSTVPHGTLDGPVGPYPVFPEPGALLPPARPDRYMARAGPHGRCEGDFTGGAGIFFFAGSRPAREFLVSRPHADRHIMGVIRAAQFEHGRNTCRPWSALETQVLVADRPGWRSDVLMRRPAPRRDMAGRSGRRWVWIAAPPCDGTTTSLSTVSSRGAGHVRAGFVGSARSESNRTCQFRDRHRGSQVTHCLGRWPDGQIRFGKYTSQGKPNRRNDGPAPRCRKPRIRTGKPESRPTRFRGILVGGPGKVGAGPGKLNSPRPSQQPPARTA